MKQIATVTASMEFDDEDESDTEDVRARCDRLRKKAEEAGFIVFVEESIAWDRDKHEAKN